MTVEELLGHDNKLGIDIWTKKYRYKDETFDEWLERVSHGNKEIKRLILEKKFLFGGRILANRGLNKGSLANCATLGKVPDSIKGIMEFATKLAITFKAEQGQGLSFTDVRPKGTKIQNTYESDGIIPFMELFNTTTQAIMQGGHRRGALLMALSAWHKEAPNFITIKSDLNKINNANLSLEIDDEFMSIVQSDYLNGTTTIKTIKKDYDGNEIEYDVCPIELYKLFCRYAWQTAEPGILYTDRLFNYNLMQYVDEYQIFSTNACSEQPLPPNGMCMLSSFNIEAYVKDPFSKHPWLDWEQLTKDIHTVVRAMDDIVDENIPLCPIQEQKDVAARYRNIGIGIMGLAGALAKLNMTYGSIAAIEWSRDFMKKFFNATLWADVALAQERGNFPGYDPKIWNSDIIRHNVSKKDLARLKVIGKLRNCSLLSVAPTGSIGTMIGCSTGCEPYFALSYTRRTESMGDNYYTVNIPIVEEYKNITGNSELPDFFVTAHDIPWKNRVDMQAALQEACDTAISSTCNIPKEISIEEVERMYLYAWSKGCKGFTCYRDGCRQGVLTTQTTPTTDPNRKAPKRPKVLDADWYQLTAKGQLFNVFIGLYEGKPYEIFAKPADCKTEVTTGHGKITKIKKGVYTWNNDSDDGLKYDSNIAIMDEESPERVATLLASLGLRHGADIKYIVKTLKKTNPFISSFTAAMIRVLNKYNDSPIIDSNDVCPECGKPLKHEGGCKHCDCGYSRCE